MAWIAPTTPCGWRVLGLIKTESMSECSDGRRGDVCKSGSEGASRGTLAQLTDWTIEADKALVF